MYTWVGFSKIGVISVLALSIAILPFFLHDASASVFLRLQDQASCQTAPLSGTWIATNSTCQITNLTLNSGDEVDVDNSVYSNIALTITGIVNNSGSIEAAGNSPFNQQVINEGTINTSGLLSEPGLVNLGTIFNNGTLFNGGTLTNTGTLTNNGTLKLYFDTTTFSGPNTYSGAFSNSGTFVMNPGSTLYLGTGANFIINSGTFSIPSGVTLFYSGSSFSINSGATLSNSGTITLFGGVSNSGTIINQCGGTINNPGNISGNPVINGCIPPPVTLSPDKDSYIINDSPNINQGASSILKFQQSRIMRSIVSFDLSPYESNQVTSANLRIFALANGHNWINGQTMEVHKLTAGWTEGNGFNATRGTGPGVTWKCATDANLTNSVADCNPKWNGGSFVAAATDATPVTNKTKGVWLEFNVTSDVNSFLDGNAFDNFGWIIKENNEQSGGSIAFASRENSDITHRPQLVLTFSP